MENRRKNGKPQKHFLKPSLRQDATVSPGKKPEETAVKPGGAASADKPAEPVEKSFPLFEKGTDLLRGVILAEVLGKPRCRRRR